MSSSRAHADDTYESQNDQRLEELHTKIRTLRGITNDIHDDVEGQNSILDETGNRFSTFGNALTSTSDRAGRAFGIKEGNLKTFRVVVAVVLTFLTIWIISKIWYWWGPGSGPA